MDEEQNESTPVDANSQPPLSPVARPTARDLYDWASRLTAEGVEESVLDGYYWTFQVQRILTKLKLAKRGLIGVLGVQGAGKTAAMYAVSAALRSEKGYDWHSVIAVKVTESGGLMDSFKAMFGDGYDERVESYISEEFDVQLMDQQFLRKVQRVAIHDEVMDRQFRMFLRGENVKHLCPGLRAFIPRHIIREREGQALQSLIEQGRVILIDMPDYPKHDRRLIARDLDDVQGLWNHLMLNPTEQASCDATIVIFIQKETFNYADHFLYGKMDLIDLTPLTTSQLLEAYKQKWGGYEPFNEDALEYAARMSRGIFRRFKRYIALTVEAWIPQGETRKEGIDLELVKAAVTDEEIARDLRKDVEAIFKNRPQAERAIRLLKLLSDRKEGIGQKAAAEMLELNEMAVSRLARELEEYGYLKRSTRQESQVTEKLMQIKLRLTTSNAVAEIMKNFFSGTDSKETR